MKPEAIKTLKGCLKPETIKTLKDCLKNVQEYCKARRNCNGCEIDKDCDLLYELTGQIPSVWILADAAEELFENVEDEDEL